MREQAEMESQAVGIMHQLWAMREVNDSAFFSQTIAEIALADELGFDSVWLAEHHFVRSGRYYARLPDPEILLARLIGETRRIRLGTGIKILVTETPLRAAEKMRLLDVLANHRVAFGVGLGSKREVDFLHLGEARRELFRERLGELVALLVGTATIEGNSLSPRDSLDPSRVLYAGVRDDPSLDLAAKLNVNYVTGESDKPEDQARQVERYRNAGGSGECRGARLVAVAESRAEAEKVATVPVRALYEQGLSRLGSKGVSEASFAEMAAHVNYLVGTPDVVASELNDYLALTGCDSLNVMVHGPGLSHEEICRMLRLVAHEVVPRLVFR